MDPPEFAVALGFTHPKTPLALTLHYYFTDLDIVALEKTLGAWAADVFAATQEDDKNAVAIDGKTFVAVGLKMHKSHNCYLL